MGDKGKSHYPIVGGAALLVLAAALRGIGTLAVKEAVNTCGFAAAVGLRFALAVLLLAGASSRHLARGLSPTVVLHGVALGVISAGVFLLNHAGLAFVSPSQSSFLTSTYCVAVPFVAWAFARVRPRASLMAAAIVAVVGVWLLFEGAEGSGFTWGATLSLLGAGLFAIQVVATGVMADARNAIALSAVQMATVGVVGLGIALLQDGAGIMRMVGALDTWGLMGFVAVFSTLAPLLCQNMGQRFVPPSLASILLSTEAVFCVIASATLGIESLRGMSYVGFACIFASVAIALVGSARGAGDASVSSGEEAS